MPAPSLALEAHGVSVGFHHETLSQGPDLWTGSTEAIFQSSGREQSFSNFSKIIFRYGDTERAQGFSNAVGRQSGPAAFETYKRSNNIAIPFILNYIFSMGKVPL